MIHENVKRILKKENEFTILTKNGTLLRLDNKDEENLFNKIKNLENLPKNLVRRDFIKKLVGMKVLKFKNYRVNKFQYPGYDLRLIDYDGKKPIYHAPIMAHLAIESNCNMSCIYCSVRSSHENKKKLSLNEIKIIIDKLDEWGVGQITITGGEPLLRFDDLLEILKYANKKSPAFSLSTNGMLLNEERAKKLASTGLKLCQISLDSHKEETNSYLRGSGTKDRILRAIKVLQKNNFTVGVDCVVSKKNIDDIPDLIKFLDKMSVPFLTLLKLKPGDLSNEQFLKLSPSYEEYSLLLRKIASIQDNFDIKITMDCGSISNMQGSFSEEEMRTAPVMGCPLGHSQIVINPDGEIYPCAALLEKEFLLGNALTDDLDDIWRNNKKLMDLRNLKSNIKGKCKKCPNLNVCRGGCRGIARRISGDVWSEDPTCKFKS